MKIVVTGATGFIGQALCNNLANQHQVIALTRNPEKAASLFEKTVHIAKWNSRHMDGWEKVLEDADTIVNLAGTNIASARWTSRFKADILSSRINACKTLLQAIKNAEQKPKTIIIASAIGYYGSRDDEELTEESPPGQGFLANTCKQVESIAGQFQALGMRTVIIRTGLVLDPGGGALPKMMTPFKLYMGGHLGSGKQWMSWISLADEVAAIRYLIEQEELSGPFNLSSPGPKRNRDFLKTLAGQLGKPCILPVPAFSLKMIMGRQMAQELLLTSQRVFPKRLLDAGFEFQHPELKEALANL